MSTRPASVSPRVPEELSTSEAKLVYLYLQTTDGPTVDDLYRDLDVPKLSLYPVLATLRERGLIDGDDVVGWGAREPDRHRALSRVWRATRRLRPARPLSRP